MTRTFTSPTDQAVHGYIEQHGAVPIPTEQLFQTDAAHMPLVLHFLEFRDKGSGKITNAFTLEVSAEIDGGSLSCPSPYPGGQLNCIREAFGDGTFAGTLDYTVDGLYYLGQHRCFFTWPADAPSV